MTIFDSISGINWIAVVAGAVAMMILGTIWYMPAVFGNAWAKASGKTLSEMTGNQGSWIPYLYVAIAALIQSFAVAWFMEALGMTGVTNGIYVGAGAWLFIGAAMSTGSIFEGRSWTHWVITAGYQLVAMVIVGAIVGALG